MTISEQLKKLRQQTGLSQIQLAERIGRTQSYVSMMESGAYLGKRVTNELPSTYLQSLCDGLDMRIVVTMQKDTAPRIDLYQRKSAAKNE